MSERKKLKCVTDVGTLVVELKPDQGENEWPGFWVYIEGDGKTPECDIAVIECPPKESRGYNKQIDVFTYTKAFDFDGQSIEKTIIEIPEWKGESE